MPLKLLGINHTTADLATREAVAFSPAQLKPALQELIAFSETGGAAILSTCNRTEIYCESNESSQEIMDWLGEHKQLDTERLSDVHYSLEDEAAIRHMMRVACGLDSLILGEPQILGQLKSAFAVAKDAQALNSDLHSTFEQVFSVAKRVRTETAIGQNPVSVAYAAVRLAQQIFSDLKRDTALLIGAGETIELVASYLKEHGIKKIIVGNRTLSNAVALAEKFGGEAILLSDIPEQLYQADIVIASTSSQLPLLGKGAVEKALRLRKHKPMFVVDLAVPRDIEEAVADLDDVYLYTVDDLKGVVDENIKSREDAANLAEKIVEEGVKNFLRSRREKNAMPAIVKVRNQIQDISTEVEAKALAQLEKGVDPVEVVQQLSRSLINKILHLPSKNLQRAGDRNELDSIEKFTKIMTESPKENTSKDSNNK